MVVWPILPNLRASFFGFFLALCAFLGCFIWRFHVSFWAHQVTAGFLRTTGARNFCWIRPGEPLPNLPVPCTNGAFAYDYGGDGADNRYFRVIESSDITPAMQDAWNLLSTGDDDGPPEPVSGAVAAQLYGSGRHLGWTVPPPPASLSSL